MDKQKKDPVHGPPQLAERFLHWYCHPDALEEIEGDLLEVFHRNLRLFGPRKARRTYVLLVLLFFRMSNIKKTSIKISFIMWRNYFRTAVRSMAKHKGFTFLNVMGLTIGLTTALFILLWLQDEVAYDKFHEADAQLYRAMRNMYLDGGQIKTTSAVPAPLEKELEEAFPEVISADLFSWEIESVVSFEDQAYRQVGRYAGETFFENFTFPLILGDARTALSDISSIVISASLAERLFGGDWQKKEGVIGQSIKLDSDGFQVLKVTGVFESPPRNATFRFDFIAPAALLNRQIDWEDSWTNNGYRLFMKLQPGADVASLNQKLKNVIREHAEGEDADVFLVPYSDMHLYSQFENGKSVGGRITYVRIFSFVGIFILLIASINFMNLATARSSQRAKEIGVRKTIGASRQNLIRQFMGESILMTAISLVLAIGLTILLLPHFNALTEKAITIPWMSLRTTGILLALLFGVGILAGSYPAFFLAASPIQQVMKVRRKSKVGFTNIRRGLVIFQFILSNLLIICTITCYQQIQFIKDKNIGFQKENVVHLPSEGDLNKHYQLFKERALQHPGVLSMSSGGQLPTSIGWSTGSVRWEGRDPESKIDISVVVADYDFAETMKMELLDGRFHSAQFASDSVNLVINETAARIMNMTDPVGQKISMWQQDGQIIGLIKDFHFNSMYNPIEPLVIKLSPQGNNNIMARLSGDQMEGALAHLRTLAEELNPDYPVTLGFLDDEYAASFKSESIIATLAKYFSLIAICVSCLGLFGLAIFAAEQRHKEVSIRKVLGASVANLFFLLSKEFLLLVFVAFLIAIPLAGYVANTWLSEFAYHTRFGIEVFLVAGLATVGIAFLTIGYEALKTALNNPVEALKRE